MLLLRNEKVGLVSLVWWSLCRFGGESNPHLRRPSSRIVSKITIRYMEINGLGLEEGHLSR